MRLTKKKYLKSNQDVKMCMLWHLFREIELLLLLNIVFLAYLKWGL